MGGDAAAGFEIELSVFLLDEAYHDGAVQPSVGVATHDSGVESPFVAFRFGNNLHGTRFGSAGNGAGGQQAEQNIAEALCVIAGQHAAYFGACLQDRSFVGLQAVYVAVGRYGDVFGNHAEVIAYQVYNRGMFGSFFGIVQQD